ncbi:hypothetical protein TBK1r_22580 [Stieleria magnilauensis]|uniref:Uncharacterized protein n=1 Tax=Stieleria magnilauensis TaxID=2527963 RepID=A0ABX5XQT3_9BACT|nr:hypothetical protein TBK1r_22580 [Planctomycetes bacterium TBK1r]
MYWEEGSIHQRHRGGWWDVGTWASPKVCKREREGLANGHTQMPRQTRRLCMAVGQIESHCDEVPGAAQPSQTLGCLPQAMDMHALWAKSDLCRYQCPLGRSSVARRAIVVAAREATLAGEVNTAIDRSTSPRCARPCCQEGDFDDWATFSAGDRRCVAGSCAALRSGTVTVAPVGGRYGGGMTTVETVRRGVEVRFGRL